MAVWLSRKRLAVFCGLCSWLVANIALAQVTEPASWPMPGKGLWMWVEAKTDLSPEQVDAAFKKAVDGGMVFLDPAFSATVFFAGKIRLTEGKGAARRKYGDQPTKADDIRIEAEWRTGYLGQYRGSSYRFIALDAVRSMDLHYWPDLKGSYSDVPGGENWNVNLYAGALYNFFFRSEDAARTFIHAVASALRQRELGIKFSRFGLMWENVTPAQAAELERPGGAGVLVTMVAINGPADRAGIRPLDVVLEMDGAQVTNVSHFSLLLDGKAPGAKASLLMLRRLKPPPEESEWKSLTMEIEAR
ncbi:MAG: PDZ domain-containing protein [Candidatus Aminicenantes bacterium]|nr:PDZ domain-containing protein [Candidatus Aminicenantes bacterium]